MIFITEEGVTVALLLLKASWLRSWNSWRHIFGCKIIKREFVMYKVFYQSSFFSSKLVFYYLKVRVQRRRFFINSLEATFKICGYSWHPPPPEKRLLCCCLVPKTKSKKNRKNNSQQRELRCLLLLLRRRYYITIRPNVNNWKTNLNLSFSEHIQRW